MLCALILCVTGGTYSSKSTPNDRLFENLFMAIFIYSQSFCQKAAERKSLKKNFCILLWCLAWGFTSNKPIHYLLDYDDLKTHYVNKSVKFGTIRFILNATKDHPIHTVKVQNGFRNFWPHQSILLWQQRWPDCRC